MALEQRIESLRKRHNEIDLQILAEAARPHPDDERIHQLKWQKLSVKDNITRLMSEQKEAA